MATSPLSEKMKRDKQAFARAVEAVRDHYAKCPTCSAVGTALCKTGAAHWDAISVRYVAVVRGCAEWHMAKFSGPDRAAVLTGKMDKVLKLLQRPPK